jgi:hypothetical protein
MDPVTYVDLRQTSEERPVQVLIADTWIDGWLEAYRKDPDGWKGWVRDSTGMAETRIGWFGEENDKGGQPDDRPPLILRVMSAETPHAA